MVEFIDGIYDEVSGFLWYFIEGEIRLPLFFGYFAIRFITCATDYRYIVQFAVDMQRQ